MNVKSLKWLHTLEHDLHPNALNKKIKSNSDIPDLIMRLTSKTKVFRSYIIHQLSHSKKQPLPTVMQVIIASNTVHKYLVGMSSSRNSNVFSYQIRYLYQQTLVLLESLLDDCNKLDKEILTDLPMTTYALSGIRMQLRKRLDIVYRRIKQSNVSPELVELTVGGLRSLIGRRELSQSNTKYASIILDQLEKTNFFSTLELENLLYQYDFNTPVFFNYFAKCCNRLIMDRSGLHEQLEIVIKFEDRINSLPTWGMSRWMAEDTSIREQIRIFLSEKKQYIQQRIELRRSEIQDSKLGTDTDRMQVNLPVAQFGLFIRLFMENGLLPKEEVGKTFAYYARHFSTPKTPFISAESLQKKSTDVEFSTAKKMKGHLIGMVNWLNEHYSVSNHRDS